MKNRKKYWKRLFKPVNLIGAICSIIGLLITLWIISNSRGEKIVLEVICQSFENLTFDNGKEVPKLKKIYSYGDEEIKNLWRVSMVFRNNSSKTLIGKGNQKNIISDAIRFHLINKYKLIDVTLLSGDFIHELKVEQYKDIQITFNQWRKHEKIEYSFYIDVPENETISQDLFYEPKLRQIIDGDIVFESREESHENDTDFTLIIFKYVVFFIVISFVLFLLVLRLTLIIKPVVEFLKIKNWKKKNLKIYREYLLNKYEEKSPELKKYMRNPENMPDELWAEFNGDKCPDGEYFGYDTKISEIFLFEFFLLLSTLFLIAIFIFFVFKFWDLFPL